MDYLVVSSSRTINGEFVSKKIASHEKERQTCPLISDLFNIPPRVTGAGRGVGGLTYLWPFQSRGCVVDAERGFCKRQLGPPAVEGLCCSPGGAPVPPAAAWSCSSSDPPAGADTVAPCFGLFFGLEIMKGHSERAP